MKVSELFAEIGFKVDTKGLVEFSKTMAAIQKTILDCVSGIKLLSGGKEFRQNLNRLSSLLKDIRRAQSERSTQDRHVVPSERRPEDGSGRITGTLIFIANLLGDLLSKIANKIISKISKFAVNFAMSIRKIIHDAMAYRDYRSFTGRSPSELARLMALAANTTDMRPQDILRDAQQLGKGYWDIFFGKGDPSAYLRLGLIPVPSGAQNLRNILTRVFQETGGMKNRGLAMSLLGSFGLDMQYMNILDAMARGKSIDEVYRLRDNEIDNLENANLMLNQFTQQLEQAKIKIVEMFVNNGTFEKFVNMMIQTLKNLMTIFQSDAFGEAGIIGKIEMILDAFRMSERGRMYLEGTGQILTKTGEKLLNLADLWDKYPEMRPYIERGNELISWQSFSDRVRPYNITIHNDIDARGQTPEEAGSMLGELNTEQMKMNGANIGANTLYAH